MSCRVQESFIFFPAGFYLFKLTIETLEQGVKLYKVNNKDTRTILLLTLNIFHTLF